LRDIKEIYENIDELRRTVEGEDAIEEVKREYVPYENNMKSLLASETIDSFLTKHDEMCTEDSAVLEYFNLSDASELKSYIEEKEIDLETLKGETVYATCEALKFLIYEAEEEEY
jgi:hypothetical protein